MNSGLHKDATPRSTAVQAAAQPATRARARAASAQSCARVAALLIVLLGGATAAPGEAAPPPANAAPPAADAASPLAVTQPLGATEAARYMRHLARELRVLVRDTPIEVATLREDGMRLRIPAAWLFRSDAHTLRPEALVRLDALALALAGPAGERTLLAISGHSDSLGMRDFNEAFTRTRAEALRDYLAGKGVAEPRMQARGLGESALLEKVEDTPAARQRNRRIEVEIRPARPSRRAAS